MAEELKNIEQIDRYLQGRMSGEEKLKFEEALRQDHELKASYDFVKDTQEALVLEKTQSIKDSLRSTEGSIKKRRQNSFIVRVAASIVLLCVIGYVVFVNNKNKPGELFDAYYKAYPNVVSPVSRSDANGTVDAYQLYESGNYKAALAALQDKNVKSDTVHFYVGQVYLAMDEASKAQTSWQQINDKSSFYEAAQWYLALSYLKTSEELKSRDLLQQISEDHGSYSARADRMLEEF